MNFENEEPCKKIKYKFGNETFSFETVSNKDVLDLIKQFPENKATNLNEIRVSVLKKFISVHYEILTDIFNKRMKISTFPKLLKKSEVTPVFKKFDPIPKTEYHPVSTPSNFSNFSNSFTCN